MSFILKVVILISPLLGSVSSTKLQPESFVQKAVEVTRPTKTTQITEISTTTTEGFQTTFTSEILTTTTVCPDGFELFGDYCFRNPYYWVKYSEAMSFCLGLEPAASLPYPTGDLETWQAAVGKAAYGDTYWSGATMQGGEVWRWADGSDVLAGAWRSDQPNDSGPCSGVCSPTGQLCDTPCSGLYYTLCQVPVEVTTTTETTQITEVPTTTTEEFQTTLTTEILTTTEDQDECYSCLGCPDVEPTTHREAKEPDQSCFTAIYGNEHNVVRGLSPQLHHEGECEVVDHVLFCYCNYSRCNGEHVLKHLTQNIDFWI